MVLGDFVYIPAEKITLLSGRKRTLETQKMHQNAQKKVDRYGNWEEAERQRVEMIYKRRKVNTKTKI